MPYTSLKQDIKEFCLPSFLEQLTMCVSVCVVVFVYTCVVSMWGCAYV